MSETQPQMHMTDDPVTGAAAGGDEGARGNASVEFIGWTVMLVLPLAYLVIALSHVQAAAFASTSGIDAAARILEADTSPAVEEHARAAAQLALADHGLSLDEPLHFSCPPRSCTDITVSMTVSVGAPFLSDLSIGTHLVTIDAQRHITRGAPPQ